MRFPASAASLRDLFLKRVAAICLGVLSCAGALVAPQALAKNTGELIAAGHLPLNPYYSGIAVGDVNGDHREDFVESFIVTDPVTGRPTSLVQTFLNNGDGTFKTVTALADLHGQTVAALADFNGDGIPDLVCMYLYVDPNFDRNYFTDVEVSFGHGDGTFAAAAKYTQNGRPFGAQAADITGDGKIDIVAAEDGFFWTLVNNGDGTFSGAARYFATTGNGFTLADVNGDGRSDLLVPSPGQLTVAFSNGAGGFDTTKTFAIRGYAAPAVVGDLNGDHVMDIAVPNSQGVDVLIGDGAGKFHAGTPVNSGPASAAYLFDMNQNGKLDLLVSLNSTNPNTQTNMHRVSLYPGNGNGTFSAPRMYNGPGGNGFLGVFDVMGNHAADVVMTEMTVFPGDGYGSLQGAPITRSADANAIATGDFNRDGKTDVLVVNTPECQQCESTVSFFPGTGGYWFGTPKVSPTGLTNGGIGVPIGLAVGDINRDGKLDVALAYGPVARILLGNGDGSFQSPRVIDLGQNFSEEVFFADVNNDGKLDLVLECGVMLGNGDGTFGALIPLPAFASRGILAMGVADLNGDGKTDIAIGLDVPTGTDPPDSYDIAILVGDGKGNFTKSSEWSVNSMPKQIVPARMHTGTAIDLVIRYYVSSGFSILLNDGHGNFPANPNVDYQGPGNLDIAVGDINGDGINDVVGMGYDQLTILLGKGDGTVEQSLPQYNAVIGTIALGDINHDGTLDVLTASPLGVSRFMNAAIPAK